MKQNSQSHLTFVGAGAERDYDADGNDGTRIHRVVHVAPIDERLQQALPAFLSAAVGTKLRGICTGLVDRHGQLVSVTTTPLADGPVLTVVVGRHSHADLSADGSDLALRHLALVYTAGEPDCVRAFDLRAEATAKRKDGAPIDAVMAGLPTVFQLGSYLLLVAATPLVHVDGGALLALSHFGGYAPIGGDAPGTPFLFHMKDFTSSPSRAALSFSAAPRFNDYELPGREPTGEITGFRAVGTPLEHWFRPTTSALSRGVLIGRYSRCDAPSDGSGWSQDMSRVHALLFYAGGGTYLCDLGSTFGVEHESLGRTRLKHLRVGDVFWLGSCRLSVAEAFS